MDLQLLSIHYKDPIWIAIAFLCGFASKMVGLPPLVGYLVAGFILNLLGADGGLLLGAMADLGITLLLFTIGLNLRRGVLARPEVWGVASLHMLMVTGIAASLVMLLTVFDLELTNNLTMQSALLIGFALSFSSTVFAAKAIDELGASGAKYGQVAIGVLVIQDIAAVLFIAASVEQVPSAWAMALLVLMFPLRKLLYKILDRVGHGELLVLFGVTIALVGADIFELLGIKSDVGALFFGLVLAGHAKASEISDSLMGFKDFFLLGFFLSVGMATTPGLLELGIGILLLLFLPFKTTLYYGLFNLFCLRASTSWRASLNLANYSEFGLIVVAIATSVGWLTEQWLVILAFAVSLSFVLASPMLALSDDLYQVLRFELKSFQRKRRLAGDENLELEHISVVVFGMGRMGTAAYDAIGPKYKGELLGVDLDRDKLKKHTQAGRNVLPGDAINPDFWDRAPELLYCLDWVLLTLPTHKANLMAAEHLRAQGYTGNIASTAKYPDEEQELKAIGVDYTFNIYSEAGVGFANELKGFFHDG